MKPDQVKALSRLKDLLQRGGADLAAFLKDQHPADLAEMLQELPEERRVAVIRLLDEEAAALVIGEMELEAQASLMRVLGRSEAGHILEEMSADDVADLLAELTPEQAGQLLGEMGPEDAEDVRDLLEYDPESAGGIMTTEFVSFGEGVTAQAAIDHLRREAPDAETIYYLYVVDEDGRLTGVLSLRELIVAPPDKPLRDIMRRKVLAVRAGEDQEQVARIVSKYDLLAVPVVDADNRLLGVVTVDDAIDVLEEEATEDLYQLGATALPEREIPRGVAAAVWELAKPRLPWLVSLLFLELGSSYIVGTFSGLVTPALAAALAVFTIVMAGESGNAATQALAVVVRGIATGEIREEDLPMVVFREGLVGLLVGAVTGLLLFGLSLAISRDMRFAAAVGLALSLNLFIAKVLGGLFPVVIHRLGIDPAVASGPFITTLTDNTSMLVYYGMAAWILGRFG